MDDGQHGATFLVLFTFKVLHHLAKERTLFGSSLRHLGRFKSRLPGARFDSNALRWQMALCLWCIPSSNQELHELERSSGSMGRFLLSS